MIINPLCNQHAAAFWPLQCVVVYKSQHKQTPVLSAPVYWPVTNKGWKTTNDKRKKGRQEEKWKRRHEERWS